MRRLISTTRIATATAISAAVGRGLASSNNVPDEPLDTAEVAKRFPAPENKLLTVSPAAEGSGITMLSMNSGAVNILDLPLISELIATLRYLARPGSTCAGVVLRSAVPSVYCAGLDIKVLNEDLNQVDFVRYWTNFQQLWLLMHQYPLPLVAGINGSAVAAGCILALACDSRVMASATKAEGKQLQIGITASRAGFCVPPWVAANLAHVVGTRHAEAMLLDAVLHDAPTALDRGLVDEVVADAQECDLAAVMEAERLAEVLPHCRWMIKDVTRSRLVQMLDSKEKKARDAAEFFEMLSNPIIKERVAGYMQQLSSKSKKQ